MPGETQTSARVTRFGARADRWTARAAVLPNPAFPAAHRFTHTADMFRRPAKDDMGRVAGAAARRTDDEQNEEP